MKKAQLIAEALPFRPPVTNLYRTEDGTYYTVMVADPTALTQHVTAFGLKVPVRAIHVKPTVSVYLSDEQGQAIDYDGDPANGLTPIVSTNSKSFATTIVPELLKSENPYADALAVLGYELTEQEPTNG